MPLIKRVLRFVLPAILGLLLASSALRAAAEPVVLFGVNGLSRDWPAQGWGGLDLETKRDSAAPFYSVKLKENTEPFAGFAFKSARGRGLALDSGWREKGLVVVRIRLGTDFYGAPLKALELKLGLTLLLADGKAKSSPNKVVPIRASVEGDTAPIVIVASFAELIDPALASPPVAVTGLTLQHLEAPAGNFEIIECAFILDQG